MAILRNWRLLANGKFFKISRPIKFAELNDYVGCENFNFFFVDEEEEFQLTCDEDVLRHCQEGREDSCIIIASPRVQEPPPPNEREVVAGGRDEVVAGGRDEVVEIGNNLEMRESSS
eukprot:GHVL01031925.1.p1 GENE.GHVL01031925.1~~GHVL01031925.1.p1  ORF type:complete len:117 (+),score=27.58 GHVL01031925.1:28-378(+)